MRKMAKKRINIDLDSELWKKAKKAAVDCDVTLREWVTEAVEEKLQKDEPQGIAGKTKTGR